MFPMLFFPDGLGAKPKTKRKGRNVNEPLEKYVEYRMSQMFSPFTLYKPYLPPIMMYAAVRTKETLLTNSNEVYLEKREVTAMRKKNPPAAITDEEVYRRAPHKEKHQQQSVAGSPAFFGVKKSQLINGSSETSWNASLLSDASLRQTNYEYLSNLTVRHQ